MNANATEIKGKIDEMERQLDIIGTRQTEVYARIVGYYRSVKNWNKGKKEEYKIRTPFVHNRENTAQQSAVDYTQNKSNKEDRTESEQPELMLHSTKESPSENQSSYLFFQRKTCPNCPPMKTAIAEAGITGTVIDVDTTEGLDTAKEYGVFSAPTVIFLDNKKREIFRTDSPELLVTFVGKEEKASV